MGHNLHQAQSHDILRAWQSQRNDINHHKDFVLPLFIGNKDDVIEPIESMPDVNRYGCNSAIKYLEPLVYSFGLRSVLLFPVMTKSDHENLETAHTLDVDEDSDRDIISSSDSSASSQSYSPSSDVDDDDDDDDDRRGTRVLPKRLLPTDDSGPNPQNPFLDQNEEEEDHLLGDQGARESGDPLPNPTIPLRGNEQSFIKASKTLDVKLIKGLALKDEHNPVLRLIPKLRAKFPNLLIICDVCLCAFTSTGHCCLFEEPVQGLSGARSQSLASDNDFHSHHLPTAKNSSILNYFPISNKITCQYLAMLSLEYAKRGCNVVAPSDMMDGRILTIREKLDENRFQHVSILSYSAKFASAFYGPFRQATKNAPEFGDRRAYQLPPGSRAMALKAVERDIKEGADFIMVKPGSPYLDIVRDLRETHPATPIAIYQVSGEYAMLKLAAKASILDLKLAVNEMLTAFRRAGATIIISYFTPEILRGEL